MHRRIQHKGQNQHNTPTLRGSRHIRLLDM